jgi:hypothetical protein
MLDTCLQSGLAAVRTGGSYVAPTGDDQVIGHAAGRISG